jgi:hypothetical protein
MGEQAPVTITELSDEEAERISRARGQARSAPNSVRCV